MEERIVLTADEGMVLTDGKTFGKVVWLAVGVDPSTFYQITEAEFNAVFENQASPADYEAALARLGVV